MKKNFIRIIHFAFAIVLMVATMGCTERDVHHITFVVLDQSESVANTPVYIVGNHPLLGNWKPDAIPMSYQDGAWTITLSFSQDTLLEYKFTRGSWESEAIVDGKQVWSNIELKVTEDDIIRSSVIHWGSREAVSTVTGRVEVIPVEGRGGIEDRGLHIFLPESYDEDGALDYPVLFMLDGQNLFDASNAGFGGEWGIDELLSKGDFVDVIVVGIENSNQRSQEYLDTELAEEFRSWLVEIVLPKVEESYRVSNDVESRWIGGSSAGGTAAFLTALEYPEIFGGALCFSPALYFEGEEDHIDIVSKFNTVQSAKFYLYMDMGGRGVDSLLLEGIYKMESALITRGWQEEEDFTSNVYLQDDHNEEAWNRRFPKALRWMERSIQEE